MTIPTHVSALLLGLTLVAIEGCAPSSQEDSAIEEPELSSVGPPVPALFEARLYTSPTPSVSPTCDKHLAATIFRGRSGRLILDLGNRVTGGCEVRVAPETRRYALDVTTECGSTVYRGSRGDDQVTLFDHSNRRCEDLRSAVIELAESRDGVSRSFYGTERTLSGR